MTPGVDPLGLPPAATWPLVLWFATLTALATGLGAVPFLISRHFSPRWLARAQAMASGMMMAASFSLLSEGLLRPDGAILTVSGALAGLTFILLADRWLAGFPHLTLGSLQGNDARHALIVFAVMTIHSLAEGVGVGVAFGGGQELGLYLAVAIALHNIPEGLAISLTLVPKGASVTRAAGLSIASSLPQPLMAVPAFLLVVVAAPLLPLGLGFAAGAMLWMVFAELLPEAIAEGHPKETGTIATASLALMLLLQAWLHG